jgi:hypothetical protein
MLVLRSCFCWSSWFDFVFELLTSQQSTAHTTTSSKKSTTSYNKRNKTTRQTTIKRLGRFLSLVSSGCPGSFLCSWLVSQQNRQHTTTSYKNTTTTYNNLQQTQQKQQDTQQSNGWGVSLAYDSLLFLLLVLFRFCVCAWSVTTINITQQQAPRNQQQATTIYNKYEQKQQHIHNNQTGDAFLMLMLRPCFGWSSWFDFVFERLSF